MAKVRVDMYIDKSARTALAALSTKSGAPIAELIRRAINDYLKKHGKETK